MSYILEALKKAQAERQLGSAPTIHAPQAAVPAAPGAGASRKPLLVGLGAGALVVVAGALLLWRQQPAAPVPASVSASAPVPAASPAIVRGGAAPAVQGPDRPVDTLAVRVPAAADPASKPARVTEAAPRTRAARAAEAEAPAAASVARTAPSTGAATPAGRVAATAAPGPLSPPSARVAAAPAPAAVSAPAPVSARVPAPEDSLPYLQQLPDAQQRDIPRVAFGGYMYSANPADRLLLVDKALRHEGEEVAPGLVLEKLLPKAAVMNYRGIRYRVAY